MKKKWFNRIIDFYRLVLIPIFKFLLVVRIGKFHKNDFHAYTYSFNYWHPITWLRIILEFAFNLIKNTIISIINVFLETIIETYLYFESNKFYYKKIK